MYSTISAHRAPQHLNICWRGLMPKFRVHYIFLTILSIELEMSKRAYRCLISENSVTENELGHTGAITFVSLGGNGCSLNKTKFCKNISHRP